MSSLNKQNFITTHWDWLVTLAGGVLLVVVIIFFGADLGESAESARDAYESQLNAQKPTNKSVVPANLDSLQKVLRVVKTPPALQAVVDKKANFLASEHRVFCRQGDVSDKKKACGQPIPFDCEVCPFCGVKQNVVKIEADADHDGLPNTWELKYGLNPNDASDAAKDTDKDGFTNLEEFTAKTDPKDRESHPDYLNYLSSSGALREMHLPFYFNTYMPIPGGFRFTFQRVGKKGFDSKFTAKLNEEIGSADGKTKTGWRVVNFKKQNEKRTVKGSGKAALQRSVDTSVVTLKRAKDGKTLDAVLDVRDVSIESEADLSYSRGEGRKFTVSVGSEFELNGSKYRVESLHSVSNGCEATILDLKTKKQKTIR